MLNRELEIDLATITRSLDYMEIALTKDQLEPRFDFIESAKNEDANV